MGIVLSKNLKQKNSIKLTPSLKKSIDLLQLSRFELIKKIEKEIDENPFLEKEENLNELDGSYHQDFDFDIESKTTLRETLISQLSDFDLNDKQIELSTTIIDCIDENGMLGDEIYEIEEMCKYSFNSEEIEGILKNVIHKMEPSGVGYRNNKECIKIQIENSNISNKQKLLVMKIIFNENLDDLNLIREALIKKGSSEKDFDAALKEIQKCDLSPGLNYEKIKYIEPDLRVTLKDENFKVDFIEETFPLIKTDDQLIAKVKKELKISKNQEILNKINEAKWLLTSVKKRNDTVKKVGEYICSKQIAFFENNPLKINALKNKEIASEIGVHPSTISRILRYKYIETPKGVMPLKSLLVSSVSKIRDISDLQLMKLIKDIIDSEKRPKSDKKIAIELNKKGYGLARRTISKYRKKNNIPSSRHR
ncbi:MAG: RNA polymerase sigma-54 factor [Gammaproteobacteria bacterium]|nr:RNA polymerase sigma-54 factor [Gammaproteobacteria bacterium]